MCRLVPLSSKAGERFEAGKISSCRSGTRQFGILTVKVVGSQTLFRFGSKGEGRGREGSEGNTSRPFFEGDGQGQDERYQG